MFELKGICGWWSYQDTYWKTKDRYYVRSVTDGIAYKTRRISREVYEAAMKEKEEG